MTGRGHQEEGEAAGKWRRAQLTSAQLPTYYVGYSEISTWRPTSARPTPARPTSSGTTGCWRTAPRRPGCSAR